MNTKKASKDSQLVKVIPHLINYIHIQHTHARIHSPCFHFSSWIKHLKTAQKNEQRSSLSLSSHIWEIWSSLWRELRFALYVFVGKHTVVETQWHHFKFPWVRRKLQGGKKERMAQNTCQHQTHSHTNRNKKQTMVAGAEFQTKQSNQRRWGQRQSQPSLLIWRDRALEKTKNKHPH